MFPLHWIWPTSDGSMPRPLHVTTVTVGQVWWQSGENWTLRRVDLVLNQPRAPRVDPCDLRETLVRHRRGERESKLPVKALPSQFSGPNDSSEPINDPMH